MPLILATCLALLLAPPAIVAAEVDLPKPGQKWIELKTTNFRFFSNAGRGATQRVAIDLEELRSVLAELSDFELQSPVPTTIYVFRNDRSFEPFKIRHNGEPAEITGYFSRQEGGNYIAVSADSPSVSGVVFHEYVHFITANNFGELPVWLSEGLAEFYETFEVIRETVFIGLPLRSHLFHLRGTLPIPLSELLLVDHESPLYNETERRGDLYAESWALTHYLLLGNHDRRRQLTNYLHLLNQGATYYDAFTTSFGADLEKLQGELHAYIRNPRIPHIETRAEVDLEDNIDVRPLSYSEVLYRLGDLLANLADERPDRVAFFEASVAADPRNGLALSALALEAEYRADWKTARDLHLDALNANPDDPLILHRWGEYLTARGSDYQAALVALKRSTEIDPSYGPSWVALADALAEAGVTDAKGLEAAETAHRLLPTDTRVSKDLARIYLRLDRREDAVQLVETSFRSRPDLYAQAWGMILQRDILSSRELLSEGRIDEASRRLALANEAVQKTGNPGLHERSIQAANNSINDHLMAKQCEEAEILYASGDVEAAKTILHNATTMKDEGPVAAACRRLSNTIQGVDDPQIQTDQPGARAITPR